MLITAWGEITQKIDLKLTWEDKSRGKRRGMVSCLHHDYFYFKLLSWLMTPAFCCLSTTSSLRLIASLRCCCEWDGGHAAAGESTGGIKCHQLPRAELIFSSLSCSSLLHPWNPSVVMCGCGLWTEQFWASGVIVL